MANRRGWGEGSIYQEGGRWRAVVSLDTGRKSKTFDNMQECKNWIRVIKNDQDKGLTFKATQLKLKQYLEDWLPVHRNNIAVKSAERYEQLARDYVYPYLGNRLLADVKIEQIEKLYQKLQQDGVSKRNVIYVHALLSRSLKDAVRRGYISSNPARYARKPKLQQKEMKILQPDQVRTFLIAIMGEMDEALYHLAIKTGMRQGEILGLKWSDLSWVRSEIQVKRQVQRVIGEGMVFKRPKTEAGIRTILLGKEMVKMLRKHYEKQQLNKEVAGIRWEELDLIFPTTIGTVQSPSGLLKRFKELLERAGLENMRFHDLRHTAASLMLNNGCAPFVVSKRLGHSKPSTTMNIYGHLIPQMQEGIAELMDEITTPISVDLKMGVENLVNIDPNYKSLDSYDRSV